MVLAPRDAAGIARDDRLENRRHAAAELEGVAAHEVALRIGLVELLAPQAQRRAVIAVERLLDIAVGLCVRMQHQILADESGRIGDAVRKLPRDRVQHQARRADAVAGDDHDLGRLEVLLSLAIVVDDARRHAVLVERDLADAAAGAQFDAGAERMRPVGNVGRRLGALRTARRAVAEIDAAGAAVISTVAMVESDAHQCQPSWFIALPRRAPDLPSGSGGIGGCLGG